MLLRFDRQDSRDFIKNFILFLIFFLNFDLVEFACSFTRVSARTISVIIESVSRLQHCPDRINTPAKCLQFANIVRPAHIEDNLSSSGLVVRSVIMERPHSLGNRVVTVVFAMAMISTIGLQPSVSVTGYRRCPVKTGCVKFSRKY